MVSLLIKICCTGVARVDESAPAVVAGHGADVVHVDPRELGRCRGMVTLGGSHPVFYALFYSTPNLFPKLFILINCWVAPESGFTMTSLSGRQHRTSHRTTVAVADHI